MRVLFYIFYISSANLIFFYQCICIYVSDKEAMLQKSILSVNLSVDSIVPAVLCVLYYRE